MMMMIWFEIANGQISSIFDRVICPLYMVFSFQDNNLSKSPRIFTKLDMCIDGYISSTFDRVISPWHDNGGVLSFHIFIYPLLPLITTVVHR